MSAPAPGAAAVPAALPPPGRPRALLAGLAACAVLSLALYGLLGPVAAVPALVLLQIVLGGPLFVTLGAVTLLCLSAFSLANEGLPFENRIASFFLDVSDLGAMPFLVAIPCFTFAGAVMSRGGISARLVRIATALVGWLPGGLAMAAIVACALFAALSGSSAVTIVAIGAIVVPALRSQGYSERFAIGLMTASGAIGILAPPSLPLIVYGVIARADVNDLFIAGTVPGLVTVAGLCVYAWVRGLMGLGRRAAFSFPELGAALKDGAFALALPVLLLGAIYSGKATVIEVSAFAAVYALAVEVCLHRQVALRDLAGIAEEALVLVGSLFIIILMAMALTGYLKIEQVPQAATEWMRGLVHSRIAFLVGLNLLLLVVGCLMDIFSAIVVVAPLVVPVARAYGIDPVHLGIIFVVNLEIGFATPPFGLNLFVSSGFFRRPVAKVFAAAFPFLLVLLASLAVVTYFEDLSLALVRWAAR